MNEVFLPSVTGRLFNSSLRHCGQTDPWTQRWQWDHPGGNASTRFQPGRQSRLGRRSECCAPSDPEPSSPGWTWRPWDEKMNSQQPKRVGNNHRERIQRHVNNSKKAATTICSDQANDWQHQLKKTRQVEIRVTAVSRDSPGHDLSTQDAERGSGCSAPGHAPQLENQWEVDEGGDGGPGGVESQTVLDLERRQRSHHSEEDSSLPIEGKYIYSYIDRH